MAKKKTDQTKTRAARAQAMVTEKLLAHVHEAMREVYGTDAAIEGGKAGMSTVLKRFAKTLRPLFLALLLACVPLPASAQANHTDDVVRAKADLEAAGITMSGSCGAIKITNLVAWRLAPAFGLLFKTGGNRAVLQADGSCLSGDESREGGFATDYVIDRATGVGFDLLGDGGGANTPQWSGPENDPEMVARNRRNFREPLEPVYLRAVPPTPPPAPPAPPATAALERRVQALEGMLSHLQETLNTLSAGADVGIKSISERLTVLEARRVPTRCTASVWGYAVNCSLK